MKKCSCLAGECLGAQRLALGFICRTTGETGNFSFSFDDGTQTQRIFSAVRFAHEAASKIVDIIGVFDRFSPTGGMRGKIKSAMKGPNDEWLLEDLRHAVQLIEEAELKRKSP